MNNGSYSSWRNHPSYHFAPPPNFTAFLKHRGDKHSQFLWLTNLLPSDPNKLNLDSSLKWTLFHCSSIYLICSVMKSRWTFWFFFEIKGLRHRIRATNFSLFDLWEIVFLEISFPVCSQNAWEIDVVVLKQSFKDILKMILSSRLVVLRGQQVLGFSSSVLSALNLLIKWHDKLCFLTFVWYQQLQNMICLLHDLLK